MILFNGVEVWNSQSKLQRVQTAFLRLTFRSQIFTILYYKFRGFPEFLQEIPLYWEVK